MSDFYTDNADLQFQVEAVDWEKIIPAREAGFRDALEYDRTQDPALEFAPTNLEEALAIYDEVFQTFGVLTARELAPHVGEMDREGLSLVDGRVKVPTSMEKFIGHLRASGLLGYGLARKYGGLHLSMTAQMPINEMLARADASTGIVVSYFNMGEVVERFGSEDLKERYMRSFAAGELLGAMALTEPDYGSDLTQIRTRATPVGDGWYEITGTKRFITQACGFGKDVRGAIYTIARVGDVSGARGISFFLVEDQEVEISRLEDKLGLHASATCEVVYDRARARLIGEEGKGLTRYAMAMMNGARLGIASQSLGIAQAAMSEARKYAAERIQFGVAIQEIPAVRRLLDESEARVQAARALIYDAAQAVDYYDTRSQILVQEGVDERAIRKDEYIAHWDKIARLLTPAAKLLASEFCCKVAYDAVQIHGGVGYTEEFPIAKIYRDARITTIYEGTSQLQVVAMIGGIVEGVGEKSILYAHVNTRLGELQPGDMRETIAGHWQSLRESVDAIRDLPKAERESVAWDIAWHFAYMYCGLLLALQEQAAREKDHPQATAKAAACRSFLLLADREIQACITQVKNIRAAALNSVPAPATG